MRIPTIAYLLVFILNISMPRLMAQEAAHCDIWATVLANKKGTVTALWDDIEPFIYLNKSGQLSGVEYKIMESLQSYLKLKYKVELNIRWMRAGSFYNIFTKVKESKCSGLFGWSYYSITPERKKEVQFTLPYMPDVNVLVTINLEPMYASPQEFTSRLQDMQAFTQPETTMEEDVMLLRKAIHCWRWRNLHWRTKTLKAFNNCMLK